MTIEVFTTQTCPYCVAAKRLLSQNELSYREYDVSTNTTLRKEVMQRTGRRTVPQIFIDDQHIGGFDDLQEHLSTH